MNDFIYFNANHGRVNTGNGHDYVIAQNVDHFVFRGGDGFDTIEILDIGRDAEIISDGNHITISDHHHHTYELYNVENIVLHHWHL